MKEAKYELCEKCEKAMEEAGVVGLTIEEIIEQEMQFDIGLVVELLKDGYKVARKGWNGKGMYLELQVPNEHSKMTLPYIYMKTADDNFVPWLASQTDILAEDYIIVK